jgi:hypothetical protein
VTVFYLTWSGKVVKVVDKDNGYWAIHVLPQNDGAMYSKFWCLCLRDYALKYTISMATYRLTDYSTKRK